MSTRRYNSPRRQQQARITRERVLDVAHRLFVTHGYAATSVRQIAAAAGVGEQTIYRVFHDKAALLRDALLRAVGGPEEPSVGRASQLMSELAARETVRDRLELVAAWIRDGYERGVADLEEVVLDASRVDPRMQEFARVMAAERYEDTRALVLAVFQDQRPAHVAIDDVVDYIYAVESSPVYRQLVSERGWTTEKYVAWFVRLCERLFSEAD